eukprot:scaffold154722_cov36-Cyclotella_meneghiniana.AAC.5
MSEEVGKVTILGTISGRLQTIGPFFVHGNHFVGAIAQGCESRMVDKHIGELKMLKLKYKGFVEKD